MTAWAAAGWVLACAVPRLAVFGLNENLHGDAVVRTELAQRWAAAPHWISSFADGSFQFGPLHLYLVGVALKLGLVATDAGRWVSLLFGVLTVIPLLALARRLGGAQAVGWAGLGFACWGLHVQLSTTAASEALGLFLVLSSFALFARAREEGGARWHVGAGLLLTLACAVRYDVWLYLPYLVVCGWRRTLGLWANLRQAAQLGVAGALFPVVWLLGNALQTGSAFTPLSYVTEYHRLWVQQEVAWMGPWLFRAHGALFWPLTALWTLTPGVALLGLAGMVGTFRSRPQWRWLLGACALPALYFSLRASVLLDFVPLARFAVVQVALLLPFVGAGWDALREKTSVGLCRALGGVAALLAVALPVAVGAFTFRSEGTWQALLRQTSPVSTNPPALMQVARFLGELRGQAVVLDADLHYQDLQVAFFSRLPESQLVRARWADPDEEGLRRRVGLLCGLEVAYLVRIEGGLIDRAGLLTDGELLGLRFEELSGFAAPWHVYRRAPNDR